MPTLVVGQLEPWEKVSGCIPQPVVPTTGRDQLIRGRAYTSSADASVHVRSAVAGGLRRSYSALPSLQAASGGSGAWSGGAGPQQGTVIGLV